MSSSLSDLFKQDVSVEEIANHLQRHPKAIKWADRDNNLPLQLSIIAKCNPEVISYLLDQYPSAVDVLGDKLLNILHLAIIHHQDIVLTLLGRYPGLCQRRDSEGRNPLHYACIQPSMSSEILLELMRIFPEASKDRDSRSKLPLHYACTSNISPTIISELIKLYPYACKVKDEYDYSPLYHAMGNTDFSLDTARLILKEYPNALKAFYLDKQTFLHQVCGIKSMTLEKMIFIMNSEPNACKTKDNQCELPLHVACSTEEISFDIISSIYDMYPEACQQACLEKKYPLHNACRRKNLSKDIISFLIEKYPTASGKFDKKGKTPLHLALKNTKISSDLLILMRNACPDEVISDLFCKDLIRNICINDNVSPEIFISLFKYHYEIISEDDLDEIWPIHWCLEAEIPNIDKISTLASNYPQLLKIVDDEEYLPLQTALHRKDVSSDIIKLLVEGYPEACKSMHDALTPLFLAAKNPTVSLETLSYLHKFYPQGSIVPGKSSILHRVCSIRDVSFDVISFFLQHHQEASSLQNENGMTPLHIYCMGSCSYDILSAVIQACPEACKIQDKYHAYPLHRLCSVKGVSVESINLLLQAFPEASQTFDTDEASPLWYICKTKTSKAGEIMAVIRANPDACKVKQKKSKQYPLHAYLFHNGTSPEVVSMLIEHYQDACKELDESNKYPIEYALRNPSVSPETMSLVLLPGMLDQLTKTKSRSMIHTIFDEMPRSGTGAMHVLLEKVKIILDMYPELCQCADNVRDLPLHVACYSKEVSLEMISLLLSVYPDASKVKNTQLQLPLHIACLNDQVSEELINMIASANPDAGKEMDNSSKFPLHYLYDSNRISLDLLKTYLTICPEAADTDRSLFDVVSNPNISCEILSYLMQIQPLAIIKRESQGQPLHDLCTNKSVTLDMMKILTEADKSACWTSSQYNDQIPLHVACANDHIRCDMIAHLVEIYPAGCLAKDRKNAFPLYYAVISNKKISIDVINSLLESHVDGKDEFYQHEADKLGLCVHMAMSNRLPEDIICKLLEKFPETITAVNDNGTSAIKLISIDCLEAAVMTDLPLTEFDLRKGSIWRALLNPEQCEYDKALPIMERCLKGKSIATIKRLLYNRDKAGRKVYDIAHKAIRDVMNKYLLFCGRFDVDEGYPLHISATSIVLLANDHSVLDLYQDIFKKYQTDKSGVEILSKTAFQIAIKDIQKTLMIYQSDVIEDTAFKDADRDDSNTIDLQEFEEYCRNRFGHYRRIALKLMRHEDQYQREKLCRNAISSTSSAIPLIESPPIDSNRFDEDIKTFTVSLGRGNVMNLNDYKYCLVMPAADRNFDSILRFESPSFGLRMGYAEDIVDRLHSCHSRDLMHGDVKALNIVRLNGRMELIDLDASGTIDSNYAGAKFSSGVLPPEMFCELTLSEVEIYTKYWKDRIDLSTDDGVKFWEKIKPVMNRKSKAFVVKTFASDIHSQPCDDQDLPYELINASADIDSWSLGVLLYRVFSDSGKSLFKVNQNDDLDDVDFSRMTSLTQMDIDSIIEKNIIFAKELLKGLLQVNPKLRWSMKKAKTYLEELKSEDLKEITKSMTTAIHEEFQIMTTKVQESIIELKTLIEEKTRRLTQVQDEVMNQIKRTEKALLRGLIEAADVTVPSCFIILPEKLSRPSTGSNDESMADRIEKAGRWLRQLKDLSSCVIDTIADPKKAIQEKAKELFHGSELYLYLVDEYTMQPVNLGSDDPIYPIKINTPAKFVADVLPLMKVGLTAIKLTNMAVGLGRFFGFPVPQIPDEYLSDAKHFLNSLSDESSVASYDNLNQVALSTSNDSTMRILRSQTVRGGALREFELFLHEHDPKCYFSGLRRLLLSNDHDTNGTCCWTSEANYAIISSTETVKGKRSPSQEWTHFGQSSVSLDETSSQSVVPPKSIESSQISAKSSAIAIPSASSKKILPPINAMKVGDEGQNSAFNDNFSSIDTRSITTLSGHRDAIGITPPKLFQSYISRRNKYTSGTNRQLLVLETGILVFFRQCSQKSLAGVRLDRISPLVVEIVEHGKRTPLHFDSTLQCNEWLLMAETHIDYVNESMRLIGAGKAGYQMHK